MAKVTCPSCDNEYDTRRHKYCPHCGPWETCVVEDDYSEDSNAEVDDIFGDGILY